MAMITFGGYRGWEILINPVLITFLLLFVSGVPLLEKRYQS